MLLNNDYLNEQFHSSRRHLFRISIDLVNKTLNSNFLYQQKTLFRNIDYFTNLHYTNYFDFVLDFRKK